MREFIELVKKKNQKSISRRSIWSKENALKVSVYINELIKEFYGKKKQTNFSCVCVYLDVNGVHLFHHSPMWGFFNTK